MARVIAGVATRPRLAADAAAKVQRRLLVSPRGTAHLVALVTAAAELRAAHLLAMEIENVLAVHLALRRAAGTVDEGLHAALVAGSVVARLIAVVVAAEQHLAAALPAGRDRVGALGALLREGLLSTRAGEDDGRVGIARRAAAAMAGQRAAVHTAPQDTITRAAAAPGLAAAGELLVVAAAEARGQHPDGTWQALTVVARLCAAVCAAIQRFVARLAARGLGVWPAAGVLVGGLSTRAGFCGGQVRAFRAGTGMAR